VGHQTKADRLGSIVEAVRGHRADLWGSNASTIIIGAALGAHPSRRQICRSFARPVAPTPPSQLILGRQPPSTIGTHSSLGRYCTATVEDTMSEELACRNCASISVVYHGASNDDAAVMCGGCGMFLANRGQFRQLVERQAVRSRLVTTGC
jgi:hypothetical protein